MYFSGTQVRACMLGAALGTTTTAALPPHLPARAFHHVAAALHHRPAAIRHAAVAMPFPAAASLCVAPVRTAQNGAAASIGQEVAVAEAPLPGFYPGGRLDAASAGAVRLAIAQSGPAPLMPATLTTVTSVPEPMSAALLGIAIAGLVAVRLAFRRRRLG